MPNRWWASITSSPLFISVALSTVILPPIVPGRVGERLLDGDVLQLGLGAAAERPAGRGQHELVDRARAVLGVRQLVERGVLGVDRDDVRAGRLRERHDELAADDERLLVGEREVDPLAERRDRRPEAGASRSSAFSTRSHSVSVISSTSPSAPASTLPSVHCSAARAAARSSASAMRSTPNFRACAMSGLEARVGGEADDLEVVGALDDVEGLGHRSSRSNRG